MEKSQLFLLTLGIIAIFTLMVLAGMWGSSSDTRSKECLQKAYSECLNHNGQDCASSAHRLCSGSL